VAKKSKKTTASEAEETVQEVSTTPLDADHSPAETASETATATDDATDPTDISASNEENVPTEEAAQDTPEPTSDTATDATDDGPSGTEAAPESAPGDVIEASDTSEQTSSEGASDQEVADAELLEAQSETTDLETRDPDASDTGIPDPDASSASDQPQDLDAAPEGDKLDSAAEPSVDPEPEESKDPAPEASKPSPAPAPVVVRQGGFMPMLLGGVAAAAVGFGAADLSQPGGFLNSGETPEAEGPSAFETEATTALANLGERLSALEGQDTGFDPTALDPLTSRIDGVAADLAALQDDLTELEAAQSEMEARIVAVAQAPMTENVSDEAIAAYEEELASLQDSIAAQRAAMDESMAAQRAEIEGLAAAAAEREAQALALAQAARVQSAAAAVIVQVETGDPFATELEAYLAAGGAPVGPALSSLANEGVPSLESLQEAFPDAARAALAAVRSPAASDASDGAGGLGTFLARQLGTRSVTPREGTDPDAVLSRAEAAVRSGDLSTALSEIETLPEAARSALANWQATAETRRDALAAATALTASASSN